MPVHLSYRHMVGHVVAVCGGTLRSLIPSLLATLSLATFCARSLPAQPQADPPGGTAAPIPTEAGAEGESQGQDTPPAPELVDSAYEDDARDAVDAAAPVDDTAIRRLQQVERYIQQRRWDRALEMLAFTRDVAQGGLVRRADGRLVPTARAVRRLLRELPPDVLASWKRQYEPVAEQHLDEAVARGSLPRIEQVAANFGLTEAGRQALRRLIRISADRGQFALSGRYLLHLDPNEAPSALCLRAARILVALGKESAARRWLKAIPPRDRRALLGDRDETAAGELLESLRPAGIAAGHPHDWTHPFGGLEGFGHGEQGAPLLLKRWSKPLTQNVKWQAELRQYNESLQEQSPGIIPAATPLVIGNRVYARMWGRVCAFDLTTGRLVWESAPATSGSADEDNRIVINPFQPGQLALIVNGVNVHSSRSAASLTSSLYRNGVRGLITADDQRLYFVTPSPRERQHVVRNPNQLGRRRSQSGPSSNELHAINLATGRLAWRQFGGIGGLSDGGPFPRPLAGYFFFGPPVAINGTLYAIAEKDSRIELVALDPHSGLKRWSRMIALAPRPISQEAPRRNWNATIAASQGVLLCPTTVGWLVAVARHDHSLLWAYRYAPVEKERHNRAREARLQAVPLDQRWGPAAPLIGEGVVILSPRESPYIVCLDLLTGQRLWQRPKGTYSYLAGFSGGYLIAVGARSVAGIDPKNSGVIRWTYRLGDEWGAPTGRGVLTPDSLLLPTANALVTLDTKTGKLLSTTKLARGRVPLGNLVMHNGALVSLSVDGLTVFEERGQYLARIENADRLEAGADRAHMMQARLDLAEGRLEDAAASLDDITLPPEKERNSTQHALAERVRSLRWDVSRRLVEAAPLQHAARLDTLAALAESPADHLVVRRLRAAFRAAAGNPAQAVKRYLEILRDERGRQIAIEGPNDRRVLLAAWISGRLLELWNDAAGQQRDEIAEVISNGLAKTTDPVERAELVRVVGRLPVGRDALLAEALAAGRAGENARAELLLLRLLEDSQGAQRAEILEHLAQLAERNGLPADAAAWRTQAAAAGSSDHPGDKTNPLFTLPPARLAHDWRQMDATLLGDASNNRSRRQLRVIEPTGGTLPSYRRFRLLFAQQAERLIRQDMRHLARKSSPAPHSQLPTQSIPLRTLNGNGAFKPRAVGHVLILTYGRVLQAVSLLDGQVLWSWTAENPLNSSTNPQNKDAMREAGEFLARSVRRPGSNSAAVVAANADYVLIQVGHRLRALDTLTGQVRWSRDRFSPQVTLIATSDRVFVGERSHSGYGVARPSALRAVDGAPVDGPGLEVPLRHVIDTIGGNLLLLDWEDAFGIGTLEIGGQTKFSLYDPQTRQVLWSRTFPAKVYLERGADGSMYILSQTTGSLKRLDVHTGQVVTLGSVPTAHLERRHGVYFFADGRNAYVLVNKARGNFSFFSSGIPTINANGTLYRFDKRRRNSRWDYSVLNRRLLIPSIKQLPVLLFVAADKKRVITQNLWQVNLLAVRKSDGATVLDRTISIESNPMLRDFRFDPRRSTIDLASYKVRLRIAVPPRPPAPAPVIAPRP